jgi:hypothetical protein
MVQDAVARLLSETKHLLSVEDFDDIARLNDLAWKIAEPEDPGEWDLLSMPVRCGNILLYQPTLGVRLWIEECALPWFQKSALMLDMAIAYALSRTDLPGELWELTDRKTAQRTISRWWRGVHCSFRRMRRGITAVMDMGVWIENGDQSAEDEGGDTFGFGPLVALLTKEGGGTPEYWMWKARDAERSAVLAAYVARMDAGGLAEYKAVKKANPKASLPLPEHWLQLNADMTRLKNQLREKWKAGSADVQA